ncbi:hypothetical protein C8R45DRAFT_1217072 [Mycena sanguinolenta]|nr:hypothetical protein C8R45DRAFT_1217072 [Mycena sanguinolenta]
MGKGSKKEKTSQLRPRTTRSSKGRLLTDPTATTALLTEQLRALGLYAAPTLGDGNCLFRALSDPLYGSPSRHPQLRKEVCDWIARHRWRYEPFVEDERGLETHLRCMRENGGCFALFFFHSFLWERVPLVVKRSAQASACARRFLFLVLFFAGHDALRKAARARRSWRRWGQKGLHVIFALEDGERTRVVGTLRVPFGVSVVVLLIVEVSRDVGESGKGAP